VSSKTFTVSDAGAWLVLDTVQVIAPEVLAVQGTPVTPVESPPAVTAYMMSVGAGLAAGLYVAVTVAVAVAGDVEGTGLGAVPIVMLDTGAAAAVPMASGEANTADTEPITTAAAAHLLAGRFCQLFINCPLRCAERQWRHSPRFAYAAGFRPQVSLKGVHTHVGSALPVWTALHTSGR
jgi:hypothetical protein